MQLHFETQNLKLDMATGDQCKNSFKPKETNDNLVPIMATLQGTVEQSTIDQVRAFFARMTSFDPASDSRNMPEQIAALVEHAQKKGLTRDFLVSMMTTAIEFQYGDR